MNTGELVVLDKDTIETFEDIMVLVKDPGDDEDMAFSKAYHRMAESGMAFDVKTLYGIVFPEKNIGMTFASHTAIRKRA